MKRTVYSMTCLMLGFFIEAQVGINTDSPRSTLEVRATNDNGTTVGSNVSSDGVTLPRVNTLENPGIVGGQLVYLTQNWDKYSRGTHVWDESIPDWIALGSAKGTGDVVWAGKLTQDFVQAFNAGGGGDGINPDTRVGADMIADMVDEFNMFDNSTGTFSPIEDGVYRIEIKYDYSYIDVPNNTWASMAVPAANQLTPYTLYGLYNETDNIWIFRNYEYNLAGRRMGYSPVTGGFAGSSNFTIGYIDMQAAKNYAFYFVSSIQTSDWDAGKRIVVAAQNSGTTGTSDATYFVIQKVQGL